MAFARWDPLRDLLAIQQRLDPFAPGPGGWVPAVDLQETADQYVLTAELPGLTREDIEIQLHDGRLTLSGVRRELFGEIMMFLYFGYAVPLSTTIARGFYRDGVWSDSGFMRWGQISAVSWREDEAVTLVLISHFKSIAQRLQVPGHLYGQARRVLRDKVQMQDIHIGGSGLDLGSRDDRDSV